MNCHKCGLPKVDVTGSVLHKCMCHWQSLPTQRTWVGLTDEEVRKIAYNTAELKVAKDIEAKLKEKNT